MGAFVNECDLEKVLRLEKYGFDLVLYPQRDGTYFVKIVVDPRDA